MKLLILFIILNVVNVVLQTVRSIVTVTCGKTIASLVNAVAYGLYTIVIVYTNCDLNLWAKVAIVALANFIGVYVVKLLEEKARKDKLWKVEATVLAKDSENLDYDLRIADIPHNMITTTSKYYVCNCFCATQNESEKVKNILNKYNVKYFVSESEIL